MRMQAYRLSLSIGTADDEGDPARIAEFERSLRLLRDGDPERPLFMPWDDTVRQDFEASSANGRFPQKWVLPSPRT